MAGGTGGTPLAVTSAAPGDTSADALVGLKKLALTTGLNLFFFAVADMSIRKLGEFEKYLLVQLGEEGMVRMNRAFIENSTILNSLSEPYLHHVSTHLPGLLAHLSASPGVLQSSTIKLLHLLVEHCQSRLEDSVAGSAGAPPLIFPRLTPIYTHSLADCDKAIVRARVKALLGGK